MIRHEAKDLSGQHPSGDSSLVINSLRCLENFPFEGSVSHIEELLEEVEVFCSVVSPGLHLLLEQLGEHTLRRADLTMVVDVTEEHELADDNLLERAHCLTRQSQPNGVVVWNPTLYF